MVFNIDFRGLLWYNYPYRINWKKSISFLFFPIRSTT